MAAVGTPLNIDHSPQIQFLLNNQQTDRHGIVRLGIERRRPLVSAADPTDAVTDCLNGQIPFVNGVGSEEPMKDNAAASALVSAPVKGLNVPGRPSVLRLTASHSVTCTTCTVFDKTA